MTTEATVQPIEELTLRKTPAKVEIIGKPPPHIFISLELLAKLDSDTAFMSGADRLIILADPHPVTYRITGWDGMARALIAALD